MNAFQAIMHAIIYVVVIAHLVMLHSDVEEIKYYTKSVWLGGE